MILDLQAYEEMFIALQAFMGQASEACDAIEKAGYKCADDICKDAAAVYCNAKLQECVAQCREALLVADRLSEVLKNEYNLICGSMFLNVSD